MITAVTPVWGDDSGAKEWRPLLRLNASTRIAGAGAAMACFRLRPRPEWEFATDPCWKNEGSRVACPGSEYFRRLEFPKALAPFHCI